MASQYEEQANNFLASAGITFKAQRANVQTCPDWQKCDPYRLATITRNIIGDCHD